MTSRFRTLYILSIKSTIWRNTDVKKFIESIKLYPNAEYIILCIFGDRIMSSFKVIEEGLRSSPSVRRKQKEAMSE